MCSTPGCEGTVAFHASDPEGKPEAENLVLAICETCRAVAQRMNWRVDRIGPKQYGDVVGGGQ